MIAIPEEITTAIGWAIIHSIWQFGILALILKGVLRLISNKKILIKYALCLGAMLIGLLLFCSTAMIEWQSITSYEASNTFLTTTNDLAATEETDQLIPHAKNTPITSLITITSFIDNHSKWIVICWLIGMLLFTLRFLNSYFFLNNLKKIGVESNQKYQRKIDELKAQLGIIKPIQFLLSHIAEQPMTFGFLKPVILMPFSLVSQLNPEQLEILILHELSHIKRNDYLINIFQSLMEIFFFYHPFIWWISANIRKLREEACDDKVLTLGKDPFAYAQTLIQTKKHIFNNSKTHLAMNATNSNSNHFAQRIFRIMGKDEKPKSYTPVSKPLVLLGILLCIGIMSACTSLALGEQKVVSVSADKMNVLYIGVDNPITIAVSNTDYKDLKITCEGGGLEVTSIEEGKYIARVSKPLYAKLIIEGKDFKKEMNFRVKRIPTPSPSLQSLEEFNNTNANTSVNGGGNINANQFKTYKGVTAVLENFEFDAQCEVVSYEVTRVLGEIDEDGTNAMRVSATHAEFKGRVLDLVQYAESGDTYYFDNIKCRCPGDKASRKTSPMVWQIN